MDIKEIDFGKALLRTLELIIIKPLTLPLKIYKNSLKTLSNYNSADSEETNLSSDFPLYIWLINIFDALVFILYPIGAIIAIIGAFNSYGGFSVFLGVLVITYFSPLIYGLVREFAQISLKILLYLNIISRK